MKTRVFSDHPSVVLPRKRLTRISVFRRLAANSLREFVRTASLRLVQLPVNHVLPAVPVVGVPAVAAPTVL
jgi:hypothetical protein